MKLTPLAIAATFFLNQSIQLLAKSISFIPNPISFETEPGVITKDNLLENNILKIPQLIEASSHIIKKPSADCSDIQGWTRCYNMCKEWGMSDIRCYTECTLSYC